MGSCHTSSRAFRTLPGLALALALSFAASPAAGQITSYTSRPAFAAAAGATVTETFDQPFTLVPAGGGSYAFAGGTLTFDANSGLVTFGGGDAFGEVRPTGAFTPQFVRFTFASPVTAFGGDFALFDFAGITLDAVVGGNTFTFGEGFFGLVSTTPFTTLELRNASSATNFSIDNVSTAVAVSAVPEPSTVWLLLAGGALLAVAARRRATALALVAVAAAACSSDPAATVTPPDSEAPPNRAVAAAALPACDSGNGDITLPSGFCAVVVADAVGVARHIAAGETPDVLYVALNDGSQANGVLVLRDTDGDGRADVQQRFGAPRANGIAVFRHYLYVAYATQIVRYRLDPAQLVPTGAPEVVVSGLPNSGDHGLKNITFDGRSTMYVNVGSPSNSCQVVNRGTGSPGKAPCDELATRAGIWRFDALALGQTQATGVRIATGFRNTEALRYDAARRQLFGVPHGRDELSEDWPAFFTPQQQADLPAEEFLQINQGDDAGWPYCFYDGIQNKKVLAPEYGGNGVITASASYDCAAKKQPIADFPGHWAPNDVLFYNGTQFPARYRGGAFIAFHGGHDRSPLPNEGFNVTFVPFGASLPTGASEIFADGFTGGFTPLPGAAAHRPMGLAEGLDGSLYVSDDKGGRIWRITYRGN